MKNLKMWGVWWFSISASVQFMIALCSSDMNARITGIIFGGLFAGIALALYIAAGKEGEYERTLETKLEDLTQQINQIFAQTSWQAKYEELRVEYENTQARYCQAKEDIKKKEKYIRELEAALESYKGVWNKLEDGLSDFLEYQKTGKFGTE